MIDAQTVDQFLRTIAGATLAFVVLPWFVLPRPRTVSTLDAVVANFLRWVAIVLVAVHVLAFVRLFHVLPIALLCAVGYFYTRVRGRRRVSSDRVGAAAQELWLRVTDLGYAIEQGTWRSLPRQAWSRLRRRGQRLRRVRSRRTLALVGLSTPIVGVLAIAVWLRVELAMRFETLSPPEAYVHLTWAKSIRSNVLFADGIYPQGMAGFLAFLSRVTPGVDVYDITRFSGALIGTLLVFALFYVTLRLSHNPGAALFVAGAFGLLGTRYEWHEPWARQTGPLPLELAAVVALLAVPFAAFVVLDRGREHRWTLLAAGVAVAIIHPLVLLVLVPLALVAGVATAAGSGTRLRAGLVPARVALTGGVLGLAYIPLAAMLGLPVYRGLDVQYVSGSAEQRTDVLIRSLGTSHLGHTALSLVAAIGVVVGVAAGVHLIRRGERLRGTQLAVLAAVAAVPVAMYDVRWIPLPALHAAHLGNITGPAVALGIAAGLAGVATLVRSRDFLRRTVAMLVVGSLGLGAAAWRYPPIERERQPSEYEATATVTRQIMRDHQPFSYTVIGTPQQRQLTLGSGTFIELWVFARDVTVRDARDPGFAVPDLTSLLFARDLGESLPIPTQDVYLFVEKEPYPVPEQEISSGPHDEYYANAEKRGRIMALAYAWAEFYRYYHTDMEVYFEDDDIVVYRITRRPSALTASVAPQFKDYTWQPGVLFHEGPDDPDEIEIPWREADA